MARRSYTAEFKREAVRLASKTDVSRRQVAKQLGIHPNVLAAWMEKVDQGIWNDKPGAELKSEQCRDPGSTSGMRVGLARAHSMTSA